MNSKTFIKALSIKAKQWHLISKNLAKSYVSLFLVLILGVTSSFAWFSEHESARISQNELEFQSASSLRINKDDSAFNVISIPAFKLDEATSYDGRNVYFPVGCSFNEETADMFFREANAGDGYRTADWNNDPEHRSYVYKDFDLQGSSGNTAVYIKSYKITVSSNGTVTNDGIDGVYEDQLEINYNSNGVPLSQNLPPDNCPIRLAFIADNEEPIVIDPSAQVQNYVENSDAVYITDDNGSPVPNVGVNQVGIKTTNAKSFSNYYYKNTPLFTIDGGHNKNVTLVVWLEGTMGNCDRYIGKTISVDIDIESNFAAMETIKFIDGTQPDSSGGQQHWVANDNPIIACSYEDPFSDDPNNKRWKTVVMTRMSTDSNSADYYTWTCEIPKKAVENISFYRLSKKGDSDLEGTIYNAWHTSPNISHMIANSSIPNGWYQTGSFDLQTSRQMTDDDNNTYNSTVYTAVHGNGRGVTTNKAYRLAPCVGYWDYGGSVTPTPTQAPATESGGSGGGESSYAVNVHLETTNQPGVDTDCTNHNCSLWFTTSSGAAYPLTRQGPNSYQWSGSLANGEEIQQFQKRASANQIAKRWNASPTHVVTAAWDINYYLDSANQYAVHS